jgi:hypothetical protein
MNLKNQLIRLGNNNPELRKHLKPILDKVAGSSSVRGQVEYNKLTGAVNVLLGDGRVGEIRIAKVSESDWDELSNDSNFATLWCESKKLS